LAGHLRLGFLTLDGRPIAAQIWILHAGRALLYKLAHDRAFDCMSPGTVLTADMIGHLLDSGQVEEIDLGAGDQPWKALWAGEVRLREGVFALQRRSIRGRLAPGIEAARHLAAFLYGSRGSKP
jgi:CelD/BcsL family acetyltransferase involved in cellulose biosynthesis